ncbi:MAG: glycosyltransferase [Proteobacteria bacterium]|nr:glycosyltransferase [Pseudomonadota bacterium]
MSQVVHMPETRKSIAAVISVRCWRKSQASFVRSLRDVSVVHLKNTPLFSKVIPSKIFESFAMGLPVLTGVPKGEATALVEQNNAGIVFEPENTESLVAAINQLIADPAKRNALRENCRSAAKQYDRRQLALDMLHALEQVMQSTK